MSSKTEDPSAVHPHTPPSSGSEIDYRELVEAQSDMVVKVDAAGRFLYVNPAYCRTFGKTAEELLGSSFTPLIHENDREPARKAMEALWKPPHTACMEQRCLTVDGWRWFSWQNTTLLGPDGQVTAIIGVGRDITGQKFSEEALRSSNELFRSITTLSPDIISIIGEDGTLLYNSPAAFTIHGYNAEEMTGRNTLDLIHPDDLGAVDRAFQEVLQNALQGVTVRYRYRNKDGSYQLMECRAVNHLADPHINGIIAVSRAVTEMEQSLQSSEEKFATAFNLSPALMSISTLDDGRYLEVNDIFCKISGFERRDMIGKTSIELGWIPAAKREEMKAILQRDGKISDVELELKRRDGAVITVLYSAAIITIAGQKRLLSIALDISERKRNQDRLDYLSECFNQALNGSRHILYRMNVKKGGYDYLSPAAEKIHGIPYADSLGFSLEQVFECIHPDDRSRITAFIEDAVRTRASDSIDLELEYRIRKTDGSYTWLLDSTRIIVDDSGDIQYFFGSAYDINPQKLIQESLQASEERYRAIVDTQTEFVDRFLPGGTLTFVNEALCRYVGADSADLVGKSFYPFVHEDDLPQVIEKIEALRPANPFGELESRIIHPDGSVHWHIWSHHAIFDQDGAVIEYQSVGRDITRQKLAELERNNYEEKLSLALKAAKAGLWDRDFVTGKITWSRETFLLYGLDPAQNEASIATWQRVLHPDDLPMIRSSIKEAVTGHNDLYVDHRVIWPDGSIRWLKAIGKPSYDNEGRPLRISGIAIDITERKEQEVALKQSEEMSRAILSSTNDLILFIDPDGTILLANEAVAERFGKTIDAFIGTNIFPYFPEDVRRIRREKLAKAVQTRSPVRYEDDRAGRFFDNCLFPVVGADKTVTGVAVFSRDITERKHYADALKNANEDLEMRVDERTASLASANEQIRQMSFTLLKAEEQERIRIAAELHDQVGQTLLLAKMKVDALASAAGAAGSATDISSLLKQCLQDIRTLTFAIRPPLLDTAGIEAALEWLCKSIYENYRLQVDFSRDCQSIHLNNEQRYSFYMAVRELLLNVAKHAGVDNAKLSLMTEGSDLVVQVRDTGSGFETESGLGFGLFNVAQRVSLLGGRCHIDSQPGKGTVVTLTIPMGA